MRFFSIGILITGLGLMFSVSALAAFGGKPPLGPNDYTRQLFAPYSLAELNYLGINYCENMLDMRTNVIGYTHQNSDSNTGDAWHLQYPDDMGRYMEAVAWEAEFSPIVRLELQRRMMKGMILAHIPGTKGYHFFRQKSWGKTLLICDDESSNKSGRVNLTNMQDFVEGFLKVGFRAEKNGLWNEIENYKYKDEIENAGQMAVARSAQHWNLSPYLFNRKFSGKDTTVDFAGRYWLSREDKPVEYGYSSPDADKLQIVVGEPGKPMDIMRDASKPGIIHLPDRKTVYSSDSDGDIILKKPKFKYLILRKATAWGTWGYSTGFIMMWDGNPESVEALAENGYGQLRVTYGQKDGKCGGRVWLFPFTWINTDDMEYIYRNAESFLKTGKLMHNGYPSLDFVNAAPAGMASAAYMLTKYNDPMAPTARIHAENAIKSIFDGEARDMKMVRVYFPVKAAAWMIKTGKLINDKSMIAINTDRLRKAMKRMLSPQHLYDGKALSNGWEHFHLIKASWLAYDATGDEEYKAAWERALLVYTIDKNGIYRYGVKMDAPGGFETYFGAMPLGVWGHAGMMDNVDLLLNLEVAAGWQAGLKPVKDLFHDTGCGPWSQVDADPDFAGFALKGLNIPYERQQIIPVGAFPVYDESGNVAITGDEMTVNPFFMRGGDDVKTVPVSNTLMNNNVKITELVPGSDIESEHLVKSSGCVENQQRVCEGREELIYKFDIGDAIGAGIDMRIKGGGFGIDLSPDGKQWYRRLDTWDDSMGSQSLDLSFLTGSRDELLKLIEINSDSDSGYLVKNTGSTVKRGYCRYIEKNGELIYKFKLPDVIEGYIEIMAGNGYNIECSSDKKSWRKCADSSQTNGGADAAWVRMADVSDLLRNGDTVYLRMTNGAEKSAFNGDGAFMQKIAVYGIYKSKSAYVKISNTGKQNSFALKKLTFRSWID